jgi:hypothetical protein
MSLPLFITPEAEDGLSSPSDLSPLLPSRLNSLPSSRLGPTLVLMDGGNHERDRIGRSVI